MYQVIESNPRITTITLRYPVKTKVLFWSSVALLFLGLVYNFRFTNKRWFNKICGLSIILSTIGFLYSQLGSEIRSSFMMQSLYLKTNLGFDVNAIFVFIIIMNMLFVSLIFTLGSLNSKKFF
jgi:hypothetical protein